MAKAQALAMAPAMAGACLSGASSDLELRAALRGSPGLPKRTFGEASAAFHHLMQQHAFPVADFGVADYWANVSQRYLSLVPREQPGIVSDTTVQEVAAFRCILEARDALRDLAADIPRLNHSDMLVLRHGLDNSVVPLSAEFRAEALKGINARFPGFARWQELRRKAAEAAQAEQEALRARQSAAAAADLAALRSRTALELLQRVSAGGVHIAMEGGKLIAHPSALLAPADRQQLGEYRAEVAELLMAPAEAIA